MKKSGLLLLLYHKRKLLRGFCALLLAAAACTTGMPAAVTIFSSSARKLPIYSVATEEKQLAITFDAAWGAEDTGELLDILNKYNAKATFFVSGYWAEKYPEELKALYNAGHEIGNHGAAHAHVASLDFANNIKELSGAHESVKNTLGIDMTLCRPPYGEYNNTVIEAAESLDYKVIQWSIDSLDWQEHGIQSEVDQVLKHKNLQNGGILLFHNDSPYTPEALEIILAALSKDGYSFVTVSELIYHENYYIDPNGCQRQHEQP